MYVYVHMYDCCVCLLVRSRDVEQAYFNLMQGIPTSGLSSNAANEIRDNAGRIAADQNANPRIRHASSMLMKVAACCGRDVIASDLHQAS